MDKTENTEFGMRQYLRLLSNINKSIKVPLLQTVYVDNKNLRIEDWYYTDSEMNVKMRDKTKFTYKDIIDSFILNSLTQDELQLYFAGRRLNGSSNSDVTKSSEY